MSFESTLVRWPGPAAWVFTSIPGENARPLPDPFGRVPVVATVDGVTCGRASGRDRESGWLLAVPARIRQGKDHGQSVTISIAVDSTRL